MTKPTSGKIIHEALHVLTGIAFLVLVAGMWACLWVPPSF
jgi:hypothetical protein